MRVLNVVIALGTLAALVSSVLRAADPPVETIDSSIRRLSQSAPLAMQFRGTTEKEFQTWRRSFRQQLVELLGDIEPPRQWKAIEVSRAELDDHVRLELSLRAKGVPPLPVYLLLPRGSTSARRAAVLCIHGHGEFGFHPIVGRRDIEGVGPAIDKAHYDYGLQFVRQGYVVAAPCMIPFGPRVERAKYGSDPCAVTFVRMQAFGRLPISANLRDLRWAVDLLQSRDEVDGSRIGCAGLSYGGRMTMMVTAVDERIRVAAVSGALNLLQERMTLRHSCGSQIIPGLLEYGDYSEIGSLIAPRPCVWETGSTDPLIVPQWSDTFRDRLRRAYRAAGAPAALAFDRFEGGHRWNGAVAYGVFDAALRPK